MERFAKLATDALNHVLESTIQITDLEIPPDPTLGDFAFPCFKLSKLHRKSPADVAKDLVSQLKAKGVVPPELQAAQVNAYVNFTVAPNEVLNTLLKDLLANDTDQLPYGSLPPHSRGTWVLEFSSPNVAKPLNIYHLRPTALGAALDRIGRFRGFRVISINHLGDWGKQYGMLTVAFRRFGKTVDSVLTLTDLVTMYVKINALSETDPTVEIEAKQAFVLLEKGDAGVTAIWQKCVDISIQEFQRNYARLGVHFDHIWGESFYKEQLTPLIEDLRTKGILIESEGAWVVPVTDELGKEIPPCILKKSDGATIYATRDVAAALYRHEQFHFDRMTYIVGAEQKLHFKQVFGVLRKMGIPWADRCEHVASGLYRFKDAKMSTRKGNFVTLEEVLTLAKDRVTTLMAERTKDKPSSNTASELADITEKVAVGAVIFHDLHTDPAKDVEFDIERIVDFEGETGPYLQYAHTRCLSILRKALSAEHLQKGIAFSVSLVPLLTAPEELNLVKTLGQFPLHLERTLKFAKASQLAHYLIDVTRAFGAFYRECQVVGNTPELTQARLMLVEATRRTLSRGMTLIGVPQPEKM